MNHLSRIQKLSACRLYRGELNNPYNGFLREDFVACLKCHIWSVEEVFVNGDYWEKAYQRAHPGIFNYIAADVHSYAVDSKLIKMSCGDNELLNRVQIAYNAL